jgi:cytochrome P450
VSLALPPGPALPALLQIGRWILDPIPFMFGARARFGPVFTLRFPGAPPYVFVSDPAIIRDVFTGDPNALYAGEGNKVLQSIVGEKSLLLLDGPRHLRERRLVMPPFHGERMRSYATAMADVTHGVLSALPEGSPFAIQKAMQDITLDVILRAVFGLAAGPELGHVRETIVRFVELGTSPLGTALMFLLPPERSEAILNWGREPMTFGPLRLDLGKHLPWNQVVSAGLAVDEVLYAHIAERRAQAKEGHGMDVLSLLLDARDEDGQPMADQELRDEMMTMLLAGHETSATTLAWCVHYLLGAPAVLERVVREIDAVAGNGPLGPEEVAKLELVDAVIKETLRLVPIVPVVARILKKPLTLGSLSLPEGVGVFPCAYLTHHDPAVWPDPERFDPDRFVGLKIDPATYFPFGGGARRCVGMAFATFEMKLVLAELLRGHTLSRAPGAATRVARRGITLAPSDGVRVVARRRSRPSSARTGD